MIYIHDSENLVKPCKQLQTGMPQMAHRVELRLLFALDKQVRC